MTDVTLPETRTQALELDGTDSLSRCRETFVIPGGVIYLDGNSLGPPPRRTLDRIRQLMTAEWGEELIRSWTSRGWIHMSERVAAAIASLVGAQPDEVAVADSVSVNLF